MKKKKAQPITADQEVLTLDQMDDAQRLQFEKEAYKNHDRLGIAIGAIVVAAAAVVFLLLQQFGIIEAIFPGSTGLAFMPSVLGIVAIIMGAFSIYSQGKFLSLIALLGGLGVCITEFIILLTAAPIL